MNYSLLVKDNVDGKMYVIIVNGSLSIKGAYIVATSIFATNKLHEGCTIIGFQKNSNLEHGSFTIMETLDD